MFCPASINAINNYSNGSDTMIHAEIIEAIKYLTPEAEWTLSGDDYNDIIWLSNHAKPTLAEIEAEIAQIPARKEAAKIEAESKKAALLDKLGITADEAKLLLG
jgi:hypothetical protein